MTSPTHANGAKNIYEAFHLKTGEGNGQKATTTTATAEEQPAARPPQGRVYATQYAQQPGGLRVNEMIFGLKMAHLSCTDDSQGRLKGSGANTLAALEEIVGKDDWNKPLSELLKKHFHLTMDCWMDESGWLNCRAVDTQGFIASNDDTIVLSYRFSTTGFDWMTNLNMTTSEWEPDRDEVIGHAGWCSCIDGLVTKYFTNRGKPRVHTGFYNNFIYTIPMIRKHILDKLLASDATPKKVYICGCSLGAALATLAYCFILEEMMPSLENPEFCNHKLINVTAGSPRVCDNLMREQVMARMKTLRPLDRAVICRMVYNHDMVPHIPLHASGFHHLDKLVYIPMNGENILINPFMKESKNFQEVKTVFSNFTSNKDHPVPEKKASKAKASTRTSTEGEEDTDKTPFELECESTPDPIKDHMPYWYLTFLQKLKVRVDAGEV